MKYIKERKVYTREEVYEKTLDYFKGDSLATDTWINKYCLKDSLGNLYELTPDDMHKRLAREFARIEAKYPNPLSYEEIYELLRDFKYIVPQGSPMAGIGNDFQIVSISNCFVVANDEGDGDSYGAIMNIDEKLVQLSKRRAGVGTPLDDIRPYGMPVNNASVSSTGVVSFMQRYSNTINEVAQQGRRGALMLSLNIKHPDAEHFIDAKVDTTKVTGANISVAITDDFMDALENKTMFKQQFPIFSKTPSLIKEVNPETLWNKMIYNNWRSAEPGNLFIDTIKRESIGDCYSKFGFNTRTTNPCGEINLPSGDSCRLLLLNLYNYVENPFTPSAKLNWELFNKHSKIAQRLMDDIVDLELEKIDAILNKIESDDQPEHLTFTERSLWLEIKDKCEKGRRTGTGITAKGDMLASLNYRYGTPTATNFSVELHKQLALNVVEESINLAKERGAFPIFDYELEKNNPFLNRLYNINPQLLEDTKKYGRRNIALLTISPSGSVSILSQTTSGEECAFMIYYRRRRKINPNDKSTRVDFVDEVGISWMEYNVFHHKFLDYLKINGYDVDDVVNNYTSEQINELIEKSPYYKATSNDVDWLEKVKMQGAIQKYIDHSISITINLPESATVETIDAIYRTAYKEGCKGCTIYRDGSRSGVLISTETKKEDNTNFEESNSPKRPKYLDCDVHTFMNKGEKWIGFIGLLNGKPYEVFTGNLEHFNIPSGVTKGQIVKNITDNKKSYDFYYKINNETVILKGLNTAFDKQTYDISKIVSAILRHRMPLKYLVELIESLNLDGDLINTWKNGVKRMLKKYITDGTVIKKRPDNCLKPDEDCNLIYQEGCLICTTCGNSKC